MVWTKRESCETGSSCSAAARKFYSYEGTNNKDELVQQSDESKSLIKYISDQIIGKDTVFQSPFGCKKVVYCDHTASGRPLQFIEDYLSTHVLPHYGSTHTTATHTARQTTMFRHEARDVLRSAVRASEEDRVLLTGTGATGALVRLLHGLALTELP
ncbi:uncharacterized protein LOC108677121 [Hyalella azteca]|uniref:Uncharacterized protein LOC108677121 n=1 Tax=Hyalella azteca TaxID=294128 RepID=A0A8B7P3Y8_HYAAZ|nr:uncharacterized protein LOC108677121 [Hyalella azteca]